MADQQAPDGAEAGSGSVTAQPRRGALNIVTIIAAAVAVLALALCGVLFMQLTKAQGALKHAALPEGLKEDGAAGSSDATQGAPLMSEPQEVTYELGDFTTNSKDGKFVKLSLALAIKSFYQQDDWDNYQFEVTQYQQQRKDYFDFQKAGSGEKKKKAVLETPAEAPAMQTTLALYQPRADAPVELIPVEEGKKEAAPTLPDKEPVRPLTRLEQAIKDDNSKVRSIINNEINDFSASDLISVQGKADFKKKVMDALNGAFDSTLGVVEDIYFKDLVTT